MEVGVATGSPNPNALWLNGKGMWLGYFLTVLFLHLFLLSVPFISTTTAWTLTNVIHAILSYVAFHHLKGTPFVTADQGDARRLTNWEQIDNGEQYTATRKYLIALPVILFLIASFYTAMIFEQSVVNFAALLLAVLPKLPFFHKFRLFGINKY